MSIAYIQVCILASRQENVPERKCATIETLETSSQNLSTQINKPLGNPNGDQLIYYTFYFNHQKFFHVGPITLSTPAVRSLFISESTVYWQQILELVAILTPKCLRAAQNLTHRKNARSFPISRSRMPQGRPAGQCSQRTCGTSPI